MDSITDPEGRRQAQCLGGMVLALVRIRILAAIIPNLVGATHAVVSDWMQRYTKLLLILLAFYNTLEWT
jgi:hypothetical protein